MTSEIFTSKSPHLDLHGEVTATVGCIVNTFIHDNIKMGNRYVAIIHGWNSTIIRDYVHTMLKKDKRVVKYYIDFNNIGQTIVELDVR